MAGTPERGSRMHAAIAANDGPNREPMCGDWFGVAGDVAAEDRVLYNPDGNDLSDPVAEIIVALLVFDKSKIETIRQFWDTLRANPAQTYKMLHYGFTTLAREKSLRLAGNVRGVALKPGDDDFLQEQASILESFDHHIVVVKDLMDKCAKELQHGMRVMKNIQSIRDFVATMKPLAK